MMGDVETALLKVTVGKYCEKNKPQIDGKEAENTDLLFLPLPLSMMKLFLSGSGYSQGRVPV